MPNILPVHHHCQEVHQAGVNPKKNPQSLNAAAIMGSDGSVITAANGSILIHYTNS